MGPADLSEILGDVYTCRNRGTVVGPGDDAGVFRHKDMFLVETVDVITPIVDDPYTFGAICAANSVSDVYAMGGTPLTALAILGFATCDFSPAVIKRLLKGAVAKLEEAGACLIGGHSIEDTEFKLGFAVTGVVDGSRILRTGGASAGEVLVLTKRLGTGILSSALKQGKLKPSAFRPVIASMLELNRNASRLAVSAGARSATDVTGFGLLGHALNIAKSSGVDLVLHYDAIPVMKNVMECIRAGVVPKGAKKNLEFVKKSAEFSPEISDENKFALADPQTSGGMLISLPKRGLRKFIQSAARIKMPFWVIGEVIRGSGGLIIQK